MKPRIPKELKCPLCQKYQVKVRFGKYACSLKSPTCQIGGNIKKDEEKMSL